MKSLKDNIVFAYRHLYKKTAISPLIQIASLSIILISIVTTTFLLQNPKKEIPSEAYSCCTGPSYCSSIASYSTCKSDTSCYWTCATPTPTPKLICKAGSSTCYDDMIPPYIKTCNSTGDGYSISNCSLHDECNIDRTGCVSSIVPVNPPTSECINGQTTCSNNRKWYCLSGQWIAYSNPGTCATPTPTPTNCCIGPSYCSSRTYETCRSDTSCNWTCPIPPTMSFYDCQVKYGWALCTQFNPLWRNYTNPAYCINDDGIVVNNPYSLNQRGCSQSSVCSVLCQCFKTAQFCNLNNCVSAIPEFSDPTLRRCRGVDVDGKFDALSRYPQCYNYVKVTPDESSTSVSWTKVDELLKYGPVIISGYFVSKAYPNKAWGHSSMIVDFYPGTNKHVYNDSMFRPENPDVAYLFVGVTNPELLEEIFNIQVTAVISVQNK